MDLEKAELVKELLDSLEYYKQILSDVDFYGCKQVTIVMNAPHPLLLVNNSIADDFESKLCNDIYAYIIDSCKEKIKDIEKKIYEM